MSRKRGIKTSLEPMLQAAVRRLDRGGRNAYLSARVTTAWEKVSSGMAASHTTGAHLRGRELVVFVDGNTWATHLTATAEQYRNAVNDELGEEAVEDLRFVVSRKVSQEHLLRHAESESEEFYATDNVASVPLSEAELAQVTASVSEIPDGELREAVHRATVKDLEWKKGVRRAGAPQTPRESL